MALLFLLAVFLAWPTFGLSIVAFFVYVAMKDYYEKKSLIDNANKENTAKEVSSGDSYYPSWVTYRPEVERFFELVLQVARDSGVPELYLRGILSNQDVFKSFVILAGAMERQGASFIEQQMTVASKLVELWERDTASSRP
ncbi:hypothetical protein [Altericroceibacterium spongiae]|uniref:hypothetical protein n=1 Tax=Altericroceibacterium spongiae TaxID=2320269 RepID=UPI0011C3D878|nr:hypothetical protein [Altericroceibacterium spongiae]